MATAAAHVLNRWRSSGGVVTAGIPAAPYPDERYQTKMMWWDRRDFVNHAEPEQVVKIIKETRHLTQEVNDQFETEDFFSVERDNQPRCCVPGRVQILRGTSPILWFCPSSRIVTWRSRSSSRSPLVSTGWRAATPSQRHPAGATAESPAPDGIPNQAALWPRRRSRHPRRRRRVRRRAPRPRSPARSPDRRVGAEIADKCSVDLEHVDRKRLQICQRTIASAEVVDSDLHANFLQSGKCSVRGVDVLDDNVFGDLQTHRARDRGRTRRGLWRPCRQCRPRRVASGETLIRSTASRPTPRERQCPNCAQAERITRRPSFPARLIDSTTPDERVGHQQPASWVLPTDERLGPEDLAGAHVELRQVMQYQRAVIAVDVSFEVQFDVVADRVPFGHLRAERCDFGPAGALGRPSGLIGATQELRSAVASRYAGSDADTDGAGERLAVDHDLLVQLAPAADWANASAAVDVHWSRKARRQTRHRRTGR